MKFKKVINTTRMDIKTGDVIVLDSFVHWWKRVKVSTGTNKTQYFVEGTNQGELVGVTLRDLTLWELEKIKPHLTKKLLIDYKISINEEAFKDIPKLVCHSCGTNVLGVEMDEDNYSKSFGTCYNCGKESQRLYSSEDFKLNIFK